MHQKHVTDLQVRLNEREAKVAQLRKESAELARDLGRAEGALEANTVTVPRT